MNFMDKLYSGADFDCKKSVGLGLVSMNDLKTIAKSEALGNKVSLSEIIGIGKTALRKVNVQDVYDIHNNVWIIETPDEYIVSMLVTKTGDFAELNNEPQCAIVGCTREVPMPNTSIELNLYDYHTKLNPNGNYPSTKSHIVPEKVYKLSPDVSYVQTEFGRYYLQIEN